MSEPDAMGLAKEYEIQRELDELEAVNEERAKSGLAILTWAEFNQPRSRARD